MFNNQGKFRSINGKRLVLIVDDEAINREILGFMLADKYELIYAADGLEALSKVREYKEILSIILLDLLMPGMNGLELLTRLKQDPDISDIPVIVMTSDQDAEVESLSLGAIDFIPKPYPKADVVLARVHRTIELSEDRQIISSTERDPLTGLYNRDYFYRYAEQYDLYHKTAEMDAIVIDVNHFHMINERFGNAYGDEVLKTIGERVRSIVVGSGGMVCRRNADTFMIYCPHGWDYKVLLDQFSNGLSIDNSAVSTVRLRMGVYENADKTLDIERRFDRAKMAADKVRGSLARPIGKYDISMHEREIYHEQLIDEFAKAIEEEQFTVYYQPKFDVRPEIPVLASAEALVRWIHPQHGVISPGVFIPLFENNGLVQKLDHYVWRKAAQQIRDWKDRLGFCVPVSVNMSRIDMYDPDLIDVLRGILEETDLDPSYFLLEITESAYTQDSEQIIRTVGELRSLGFRIEMDDFGTGYSSLNMISNLPIDALKLDMQFIRNAFTYGGDTRMIEIIIDIANYLGVPVIAEGVESQEQLLALRSMGCDLVQGYYFSRPVPAEEYEKYVEDRRDNIAAFPVMQTAPAPEETAEARQNLDQAMSKGFSRIYYVDSESGSFVQFSAEGKYEDLEIESSGADFFSEIRRRAESRVSEDDRERVLFNLRRENLLGHLGCRRPFTMMFRPFSGGTEYCTCKAEWSGGGDRTHIVIGISSPGDDIKE